MKHIISKDLDYHSGSAFPGKCGLDIFHDEEYGYHWVVFTELDNNTGKSVTNAIEDLMGIVLDLYDYRADWVMWVERYEYKPTELDNIQITDGEPNWRPVQNIPGEGASRYELLLAALETPTARRSIDDKWEPSQG